METNSQTTKSVQGQNSVPMNAHDWRQLLLERKRSILAMEKSFEQQAFHELSGAQTGETSSMRLHPADLASDTRQTEVLGQMAEGKIRQLKEINEAIDRVDQGRYGVCESCGETIKAARLKLIPEARYCSECERDLEEEARYRRKANLISPMQDKQDLTELKVADLMSENPVTVRMHESLDVVYDLMWTHHIRHLPVVDEAGNIQGIVSDRDLVGVTTWSPPQRSRRNLEYPQSQITVGQIMTKDPQTVEPDLALTDAGSLLLDNKLSSLPVVEGTRLIGILTETDFVKWSLGLRPQST